MKDLLCFVFCVCLCADVWGQAVLETNPTSIKFQQVRTPHFRVLFPTGFEEQAQRVANTLEHIHKAESKSIGTEPRKISIILQNQSSESNGFVSILPRRSEFYTLSPQDYNFLGTNDWLNMLAAHEFRHVVQYQHATRGFNRVIYYLFGSSTLAAMSQAAAPQWFWEGDAVATETAFTPSGRGRIPNFGLVFKTNLLEGRTFNYHKQYLRSYKNNIPNHYVLGYHMVSYLRRKTQDPAIWGKITARAWSVPFIPFAFSNAIHNKTGLYVRDLYNEMAAELKKEWQAEIDKTTLTPFAKVNKRRSTTYTDYLYPQVLGNGDVLVMKRGLGDIEKFVALKNGDEKIVFTPGFINDAGMLSVAGSKIAWTEYGFDPRWAVRNYSLVKVFDTATGRKTVIGSKHSRLAGAALSPDGKNIVAMRSDQDYKNTIVILDANSGKILHEIKNPENDFFSMPRWSDDGRQIVALRNSKAGKAIAVLDVASGDIKDVLPVSRENVGYPVLHRQYIFFNSPVTGTDNIYAIDLQTGKRYQVTASKYAAYNPAISADGKTIYYNEQTRDGQDVVSIPFEATAWKAFAQPVSPSTVGSLSGNLAEQEGRPNLLDSIPSTTLPVSKYSKLKGVINPYTWGAFVTNDLTNINAGVSSRDILSTTSITAGYAYDINEGTYSWKGAVSYQGLYPIIDVSAQKGNRENDEKAFGNAIKFEWDEVNIEGGFRIPLTLTNSKFSRNLTLGNAVGLTRVSSFVNTVTDAGNGTVIYRGPARVTPAYDTLAFIYKDQLNNGDLLYNKASVSFYNLMKRSWRDFLYRWGQQLDLELYNTPYQGDFDGKLFAARSVFYFPGFARHHVLYTRLAYQESMQGTETNLYTFRNRIPKPRGHSYPADEKFFTFLANYALPLWYPDIALGPILNIQRVKANFFYDYGKGQGHQYYYRPGSDRVYVSTSDTAYQSVGVETTFDFNIMRFLPKFEMGFRTTYRVANTYNTGGVVVEFLIGNIGF